MAMKQDPKSSRHLNRRLHYISHYVQLCFRRDFKTIELTRATEDPTVMLELLVDKVLNTKDATCPAKPFNEKKTNNQHRMTPLQWLAVFKSALKQDDFPLRFNFMSLNWRCVSLMRRIQKICVEESPLNYPMDPCGADQGVNAVIAHMLAGVAGVAMKQPTRFLEACALLREVMSEQGNVQFLEAERKVGIVSGTAVDENDVFDISEGEFLSHGFRNFFGLGREDSGCEELLKSKYQA